MSVRKICLFPDPVLSQDCKPVENFGTPLQHLIRDLHDTLNHTPGVGIAAPQIGVSERVSVIDITRSPRVQKKPVPSHGLLILINPVLIEGSGEQIPREGCLSVPDLLANVKRYKQVSVRFQELNGQEKIIHSEGFEALALQHEIDHLNGKLFLDRVSSLQTDVFRRSTY